MPAFLSDPLSLLKAIVAFGAVVFIHELGHFLAARFHGVRVLKFAIGFDFGGLALYRTRRGDTEYVVGAFPLGGYVRMLGQDDLPASSDVPQGALPPDSFQAKTTGQRMQIISAGVLMNFVSAFVFCFAAFLSGFNQTPPVVGSVGLASYQAGLRPGDRVLSLDGRPTASFIDLLVAYVSAPPRGKAQVRVLRGGSEVELTLPVLRDPGSAFNEPDFSSPRTLQVAQIVERTAEGPTAAARAGIRPGDVIRSVDGAAVADWDAFSRAVRVREGRPTVLVVDRPGGDGKPPYQRVELNLVPGRDHDEWMGPYSLGVSPSDPPDIDVVIPGSPAARAGLLAGDRVVALDGQPIATWWQFWCRAEYLADGEGVVLAVRGADGRDRGVELVAGPRDHWAEAGVFAVYGLGLGHRAPEAATVGLVQPGSAAESLGLQAGDEIKALRLASGADKDALRRVEVRGWNDVFRAVALARGDAVEVTWSRRGTSMAATGNLLPNPDHRWRGLLGVSPMELQEWVHPTPWNALGLAAKQPFVIAGQLYDSIKGLLLRRIGSDALSGPVGIATATFQAARESWGVLFNFLAMLSVNLAVVNFLPVPITDGGHFLFLIYERLRGRRMSDELQAGLQWAGLLFLLAVFVFATWNDLLRQFGSG